MNLIRRGFLWFIGALALGGSSRADEPKPAPSEPKPAPAISVMPRHVLCFLGRAHDLARLSEAARNAIGTIAKGFSVDMDYSQDEADDRMERSFAVCWDRVQPNAWTVSDERAVAEHGAVLYVMGPQMTAETAVETSATALLLVQQLIGTGAVAVKGESAGIAHGLARWQELATQAQAAREVGDSLALGRICRLAFAKRPLEAKGYLESVGFHLVGLPEVYAPKSLGSERVIVALMDEVADEIARRGLEATLRERKASRSFVSTYDEDEFKFNPYGIVRIPA
ncbi:hypothetical protein [Bosea vaviloviae]|uniref:Uncharacterized protein n=1 Tax=Bosea vaviloviae TaxID=1526658 RepID=A0A1D7U9Z9_9HYPH|nr:hypothetical protein [Bosea vaviloviae]AOO84210.1 hypothetical protein BHK69_05575 [Bosea vaviloviae]